MSYDPGSKVGQMDTLSWRKIDTEIYVFYQQEEEMSLLLV